MASRPTRAPAAQLLGLLARGVRRGVVFVVGVVLILAGVVMLFVPGPGIAAMLLGLAVLATEFRWARRLLAWARAKALELRDRARRRLGGRDRAT
jgi:uncharacterized protein (TIGR02611 family)